MILTDWEEEGGLLAYLFSFFQSRVMIFILFYWSNNGQVEMSIDLQKLASERELLFEQVIQR